MASSFLKENRKTYADDTDLSGKSRLDPQRRAEAEVYDRLANSDLPGQGICEFNPHGAAPQLDFGLWVTNLGRFGIQVKGGHYSVENGAWYLQTDRGPNTFRPASPNGCGRLSLTESSQAWPWNAGSGARGENRA